VCKVPQQGSVRRLLQLAITVVLATATAAFARDYTPAECPVVGNSKTHIYHVPGDRNYRQMLVENKTGKDNRVCFKSPPAAEIAGYRRSQSGQGAKQK
jgi:hypothetical protein